jgi:hypothetical protein
MPPKLSARQQAELVRVHSTGEYTIADLVEVFSVGRATVYRALDRAGRAGGERKADSITAITSAYSQTPSGRGSRSPGPAAARSKGVEPSNAPADVQ